MSLRHVLRSIKHGSIKLFNRCFRHWNYVMKYDRSAPRRDLPAGVTIERFAHVDAIPGEMLAKMRAVDSDVSVEAYRHEMRHKGSVLWVALRDGEVIGTRLSRRGRHIPVWFIPLQPDDLLLYRGKTTPACRGQGLSPAMMQYIIDRELSDSCSAYSDCRIYNHPSIRSLSKAGFRIVGKLRPISEPDEATAG